MTSLDENKALIRRFFTELDEGNLDVVDELVAENFIDHDPPPFPGLASGRAGLKQAAEMSGRLPPATT
jgi:ketosteroid isomerase-like protein